DEVELTPVQPLEVVAPARRERRRHGARLGEERVDQRLALDGRDDRRERGIAGERDLGQVTPRAARRLRNRERELSEIRTRAALPPRDAVVERADRQGELATRDERALQAEAAHRGARPSSVVSGRDLAGDPADRLVRGEMVRAEALRAIGLLCRAVALP